MATLERTWTVATAVATSGASRILQVRDIIYRLLTELLAMPGVTLEQNCDGTNYHDSTNQIASAAEIIYGVEASGAHTYFVVNLGNDQRLLVNCNGNATTTQTVDFYLSSIGYALFSGTAAQIRANRPVPLSSGRECAVATMTLNDGTLVTRTLNIWRDSVGTLLFAVKRPSGALSEGAMMIATTANPASAEFAKALFVGDQFGYNFLYTPTYWRSHVVDGTAAATAVQANCVEWNMTNLTAGRNEVGTVERSSISLKANTGTVNEGRALRRLPDIFGVSPGATRNGRDPADADAMELIVYDHIAVPIAQATADIS